MTTPYQEVLLDEETVGQLFFDVGHVAELLAVIEKGPNERRAREPATTRAALDAAHAALARRELVGVQLRYRFGGEEWWDTLTHTASGIRLIRISHTRALAAEP
jgi:hypothetical protein